jgi:hypothetical protein
MAGWLLIVVLTVLLLGVTGAVPAQADDPQTPAPTATLSPPRQQQIDDARDALKRLQKQGKPTPTPVVIVAAPKKAAALSSRINNETLWMIGAGVLVLLVASETTRLGVRRAKHRRGA